MIKKKRTYFTLAFCILFSLISSYLLVLSPAHIGKAVDLMIGENNVDIEQIRIILIQTSLIFAAYFVLTWIVSWASHHVSVEIVKDLRQQLAYRLNRNSLSYLDTKPHGSLLNLFALDGEILIDGIFQLLSQLFSGIFVVVIALIFMLRMNVIMTFLVVLMVPLMYFSSRAIARRSIVLFRRQQKLAADLSSHVSEAMLNHELIMSSNYQNQSKEDFEAIHTEYNDVGEKAQILGALVNPTVRVINNLSYALIGLLGAFMVLNGNLSVGTLTSFVSISIIFSKPFNEFSAIISQVMAAQASYDRIKEALSIPLEIDEGKDQRLEGNIVEFDNVDFSYVQGKPIIKDLSLYIPPLSKVAIVGPTGAGKSTLINILMRFYDVDSGTIMIDGVNTQMLSKQSIREVMSIVLQDPWLFEGTIKENIKYGKEDASDEDVIEAAKQAGCHDYIMSLDEQYDTKITLGSTNISVGQKQMITIARAIIVDAPIIILDEATSNIDVLTEYKIQEVFSEIMANKTSFFVAHRLATVVDSDIILVMKDGKLVEQGNHKELMDKKGFYFELFMSQYEA